MLREYGGDVPERLLQRLVATFAELREMADDGLIAYPYSTREVVAICYMNTFMSPNLTLAPSNGYRSLSHTSYIIFREQRLEVIVSESW